MIGVLAQVCVIHQNTLARMSKPLLPSPTEMKRKLTSLFALLVSLAATGQTALVQVGNASADVTLAAIDVWADTVKIAANVNFATSTAYMEVATDAWLRIAPAGSNDTAAAICAVQLALDSNSRTVAFFNGHSGSGYTPIRPPVLHFVQAGQPPTTGYTNLRFYNGATDLATATIHESTLLNETLAAALLYGSFSATKSVESLVYHLNVADGSTALRQTELNLLTNGWADSTLIIALAGFVNPAVNNAGKPLSVYAVPPAGGAWKQLPNSTARIQLIHNSADTALPAVDFYYGANPVAQNVTFRSATPHLEVAAGMVTTIAAAKGGSTSAGDTLVSTPVVFDADKTYAYVLNGLTTTAITPFKPLAFAGFESRTEAHTGYNTDIMVVNGCTDGGAMDIQQTSPVEGAFVADLPFGEMSGYHEQPSADYGFELWKPSATVALREYHARLSQAPHRGSAQVWLISGFADTATHGSTRMAGIWVASPAGGALEELGSTTGIYERPTVTARIYPNPTANTVSIEGRAVSRIEIVDLTGKTVLCSSGTTVDVTALPCGVYHLCATHSDGVSRHVLVVAK